MPISIEKLLYKKVAEKIQERREEIATSILENANQYKGDPSVERLATQSPEEFDNPNIPSQEEQDQIRREDCMERLKKKYPDKDKAFYDQKIEDGECRKLDEAKKPTKPAKKPTKPAKKPKEENVSSEMAPIRPEARQQALDILLRGLLGR